MKSRRGQVAVSAPAAFAAPPAAVPRRGGLRLGVLGDRGERGDPMAQPRQQRRANGANGANGAAEAGQPAVVSPCDGGHAW